MYAFRFLYKIIVMSRRVRPARTTPPLSTPPDEASS